MSISPTTRQKGKEEAPNREEEEDHDFVVMETAARCSSDDSDCRSKQMLEL